MTTQVFGHRGASAAAPENTIEAYRLAGELGAEGVELDVRRTADGVLVLHHDAVLPDGRLLAATRAGDLPGHVPTFDAGMDACAGMVVNVEIKNVPYEADFDPACRLADAVVAALADRTGDDVLISSFHLETVDRVKELAPHLPTGFLTMLEPEPLVGLDLAVRRGHDAFHPHHAFVDHALVEACGEAGVALNTWTVDEPARLRELVILGVAGIVTNAPDVARAVVDEVSAG